MNTKILITAVCLGTFATLLVLAATPARSQQAVPPRFVPLADGRVPIDHLPFSITQCGSYVLVECLQGSAGLDGIHVRVSDVTLDLNGFTLTGVAGSGAAIAVDPGVERVRILDGNLTGWGAAGVEADQASACDVRGVQVSSCAEGLVLGSHARLSDCSARDNAQAGIQVGAAAMLDGCSAAGNGTFGITAGKGSLVRGCRASSNQGSGLWVEGQVTNCFTRDNGAYGIQVDNGSVRACDSHGDSLGGIRAVSNAAVRECTVHSAPAGPGFLAFEVGEHCVVRDNHAVVSSGGIGVLVTGDWNQVEMTGVIGGSPGMKFQGSNNWAIGNAIGGDPPPGVDWGTGNAYGNFGGYDDGGVNFERTDNASYMH